MSTQRVSIQNLPPLARIRNEPGRLVCLCYEDRQDEAGGRLGRLLRTETRSPDNIPPGRVSIENTGPGSHYANAPYPQAQQSPATARRFLFPLRSANQPSFTKRAGRVLCAGKNNRNATSHQQDHFFYFYNTGDPLGRRLFFLSHFSAFCAACVLAKGSARHQPMQRRIQVRSLFPTRRAPITSHLWLHTVHKPHAHANAHTHTRTHDAHARTHDTHAHTTHTHTRRTRTHDTHAYTTHTHARALCETARKETGSTRARLQTDARTQHK